MNEHMAGLIGLGLLGSALAERFLRAGLEVMGSDIAPERRTALEALGGKALKSAAEVARACRRIVICLPHSGVTSEVLEEIEPALEAGSVLLDATTGEPSRMETFGRRLAARGIRYMDTTVAGSSGQVRAGEAMVMAGGEREDFEANQDLLGLMAARVFHVGQWGAAARMKLVVNLVLGLNRAVLAEGLAFATACGIEQRQALEVLKAGPAYSRAMDVKGARMLERNYEPEARLRQHHKDVRLILAEGARFGARLPLSAVHDALLEEAESAGWGELDNSAIAEVFGKVR